MNLLLREKPPSCRNTSHLQNNGRADYPAALWVRRLLASWSRRLLPPQVVFVKPRKPGAARRPRPLSKPVSADFFLPFFYRRRRGEKMETEVVSAAALSRPRRRFLHNGVNKEQRRRINKSSVFKTPNTYPPAFVGKCLSVGWN